MIAQGHELKVRLLWVARNRLPGRIGELLAAAIILLAASGVSATSQELELGIEPNLTESKSPISQTAKRSPPNFVSAAI